MNDPRDREPITDAIQKWSAPDKAAFRRLQRRGRHVMRVIKTVIAMIVATLVVVPTLIMTGLFLGPRGIEGLLVTPLVLLLTYAAIWYVAWGRRRPRALTRETVASSPVALLPAQTEDWLEQVRGKLPMPAQQPLDAITLKLEALAPQLAAVEAGAPAGLELKRLLGEELPQLVDVYRKVPAALAKKPLYGGATPEQQLVEGLHTIEQQLDRLHEQLATSDMHALATHGRFLELKYKRKDELE